MTRPVVLLLAALVIAVAAGAAGYLLGRQEVGSCQEDLREVAALLGEVQQDPPRAGVVGFSSDCLG